jgi:hypothetical protein
LRVNAPSLSCVLSRARRRSRRAGECPMTRCNFSATGQYFSPFTSTRAQPVLPVRARIHRSLARPRPIPMLLKISAARTSSPPAIPRTSGTARPTPHTMWEPALAADARSRLAHASSTCSLRPTFTTIHRCPDRMFTWQICAARAVPLLLTPRRRRRSGGQAAQAPRRPMTHRGPRARRADSSRVCTAPPRVRSRGDVAEA